MVLYPRGRVSKLQEKQFTTLGGNVRALAVDGAFDDCQRLVKAAFADRELQDALFMTSANSINIGRLLPQMVYYVHAVAQLPAGAGAPVFVVPSGNFGNLTAGLLVHELGLPVERFVAATNANDVVPEYLDTGLYRPRPSVATLSNAMDVGAPSNFARILALYDGDPEAIRRKIHGSHHDDEETRRAIRDVHDRLGVVLDPHTAVGYLGLWEAREREGLTGPGIVLATAHPAKFRDDVEPILGREIDIPKRLARCLGRPSEAREIAAELAELKAFLLAWDA